MRWVVLVVVLATLGCGLLGEPGPSVSEACGCSITRAGWAYRSIDGLDADLVLGSDRREVYTMAFALPREELLPMSLEGRLGALLPDDSRPVGPARYGTVDGHAAVWRESVDADGFRWRSGVVRAPHAEVALHAWGTEEGWSAHGDDVEVMLGSVRILERPEGRWAHQPSVEPEPTPLLEARRGVVPVERPQRAGLVVEVPEGAPFERVAYTSEGLELAAFRTPDPGDGGRHPAVLWVEGGFSGPSVPWERGPVENDQSAMDFVEAGFAVWVPSFRGELDNPGQQEVFFGETTDLLAALEALRAQPWVDPRRVYLVGHSSGGTNALLGAVAGADVRSTIVFGGRADLRGVLDRYPPMPFDIADEEQVRLRSALHWAHHLKHPVYWFEGEEGWTVDAVAMANAATGAPMVALPVPRGGHFDILTPMRALLIPKMLADDPDGPPLTVTEEELLEAMIAQYGEDVAPM